MSEEVAQLGKEALACILMHVMFAAKNVRAQRDRLLQLRRRLQLQQRSPGDAAVLLEVASGLHKVSSEDLECAARYLTAGLQITAEHGARASFSIPAFAFIPTEQLYGVLLAQGHPPRPTTQTDAFARIESAFYAVKLSEEHHVPRCVQLLRGAGKTTRRRGMVGYWDDPVTAANEHIVEGMKNGPSEDDDDDTDPASDDDDAADPTVNPPQTASILDTDQALSYLHRACSLTNLAVKHIGVAVAVISSFLDPEVVDETSDWADEHAHISELISTSDDSD